MTDGTKRTGDALREILAGKASVGTTCGFPSADTTETIARAGFNWLLLDMQHSMVDRGVMVQMIRAADITGTPSLVRIASNRPELAGWALDAGAQAVVAPMINNANEARELVAACRYAPSGLRSWGAVRPMLAKKDYAPESGNGALVCAMLETTDAIENLDQILDVEGVDLLLIGQSDLAISFGLHPMTGREDPAHMARLQRILDGCTRRNLPVIVNCSDAADARPLRAMGFQHLLVNSDIGMLKRAATGLCGEIAALRD
jgi:4-hydroxy-2-oxoheptanedioate aldolase